MTLLKERERVGDGVRERDRQMLLDAMKTKPVSLALLTLISGQMS